MKVALVSNNGDKTRKSKGPHCESGEFTLIIADSNSWSWKYDWIRTQKNPKVPGNMSRTVRRPLEKSSPGTFICLATICLTAWFNKSLEEINEDQWSENSHSCLFRACYSKDVSHHHCVLVETQRQAKALESVIGGRKGRYVLIGVVLAWGGTMGG